jgi:hypothetical protein
LIFDSCKIVAGSSLIIAVSVFRFFINPSATAQDNRSDALVSIGAFVGIIIKARIHGNNVLLDVTIQVNSSLSVVQSHDISDATDAPKSLSRSRYTLMLDLRTLKKPTHYERAFS